MTGLIIVLESSWGFLQSLEIGGDIRGCDTSFILFCLSFSDESSPLFQEFAFQEIPVVFIASGPFLFVILQDVSVSVSASVYLSVSLSESTGLDMIH